MRRKIIYIAKDRKRFDRKKDCEKYEGIMQKVNMAMKRLRDSQSAVREGNAVKQDTENVKQAFAIFMDICSKAIPDYKQLFQEVKDDKRDISHADYILEDYSNDFPCLFRAMRRFMRIDKDGIEYGQIYFVRHKSEFQGKII